MASLIKFKPLEWRETRRIHHSWWPRALREWVGGDGFAHRVWTARRLGVSVEIIERPGEGYVLYICGKEDFIYYKTLDEAQNSAEGYIAAQIRKVLEVG